MILLPTGVGLLMRAGLAPIAWPATILALAAGTFAVWRRVVVSADGVLVVDQRLTWRREYAVREIIDISVDATDSVVLRTTDGSRRTIGLPDRRTARAFAEELRTLAPAPDSPPRLIADRHDAPTRVAGWLREAGVAHPGEIFGGPQLQAVLVFIPTGEMDWDLLDADGMGAGTLAGGRRVELRRLDGEWLLACDVSTRTPGIEAPALGRIATVRGPQHALWTAREIVASDTVLGVLRRPVIAERAHDYGRRIERAAVTTPSGDVCARLVRRHDGPIIVAIERGIPEALRAVALLAPALLRWGPRPSSGS